MAPYMMRGVGGVCKIIDCWWWLQNNRLLLVVLQKKDAEEGESVRSENFVAGGEGVVGDEKHLL